MKTFDDLVFKPHGTGDGLHAIMFFPNGYGVSVVRFKFNGRYGSYTADEHEWELAVLKGDETNWGLCYSTRITNDVIGYLYKDDVTKIMRRVQLLRKDKPKDKPVLK